MPPVVKSFDIMKILSKRFHMLLKFDDLSLASYYEFFSEQFQQVRVIFC